MKLDIPAQKLIERGYCCGIGCHMCPYDPPHLKKNKDKNRYFHLVGGGATCWVIWQSTTLLGIILGASIPEKLGLSFAVPLTFLALLVNDFRKLINVLVIIVSGLIATLGYNYIPFKAYVIVAALTGLLVAMILTKMIKK